MNVETVQRYLRQIALPEIGPHGQERLASATIAVAGADLLGEVAARYLAAAGVGRLRLIARPGDAPLFDASLSSLRQSNPALTIERVDWPADGAAWLAALEGVDLVLRSGFDDDAMLRAAVRLGIPAIVARATAERAELVSFRKQGPCPHAALDVAPGAAEPLLAAGPAATVAGTLAAAEALLTLVAGVTDPAALAATRHARHLAILLQEPGGDRAGDPRAQEIPWSPECFACGGSAMEMAFT